MISASGLRYQDQIVYWIYICPCCNGLWFDGGWYFARLRQDGKNIKQHMIVPMFEWCCSSSLCSSMIIIVSKLCELFSFPCLSMCFYSSFFSMLLFVHWCCLLIVVALFQQLKHMGSANFHNPKQLIISSHNIFSICSATSLMTPIVWIFNK